MRSPTRIFLVICLLIVGSARVALAQSPSIAPVSSTQAVDPAGTFVLPIGGYAVSFPDGWEVHVLPVTGSEIPVVRAEAPPGPDASEAGFCEIKASRPPEGVPSSAIDEAAALEVAWFESGTEVPVPAVVESVDIPLAAGYAVRVHTQTDDPPLDRSIYHLTDGRVVASLLCMASQAPEDHWLSVAESFAFLPVEQG